MRLHVSGNVVTSGKMNSQTQRIPVECYEVNMEVNVWLFLVLGIDFYFCKVNINSCFYFSIFIKIDREDMKS